MEFRNHTPFPALAFAGIDQLDQAFHVVVLRQTYTWNAAGELIFADEQTPLCESDEYFDEGTQGSVRQESDLCQYKPRCDVIVNATAYAPTLPRRDGSPSAPPSRFEVRLRVFRPEAPAWPSPAETRSHSSAGQCLISKTLRVCGERFFTRNSELPRLGAALVKAGSLGIIEAPSWQLTEARPLQALPLRLEHAFGGACRIEAHSNAANSVPRHKRLTPEQIAQHPNADAAPIAHEALAANPIGSGFVTDWYLDATGTERVPAPQIEYPDKPVGVFHFDRVRADSQAQQAMASTLVAGLGVRPKGHPDRARLVGTIDRRFIESSAPLPQDFDFAVWNAAWPDQQVDALEGDEIIELANLCAPNTPGALQDEYGNNFLSLRLPGHLPFVLVRFEDGPLGELPARLDTVLISPDQRQVSCVWRATVAMKPEIRVLEARMLTRDQVEAFRQDAKPDLESFHG